MKNLLPNFDDAQLNSLFTRPSAPAGYDNSPEVCNVIDVPGSSFHAKAWTINHLGIDPQTVHMRPMRKTLPDMRIYDLRDVLLYRGGVFSHTGAFFIDSGRVLEDDNSCTNLGFHVFVDTARQAEALDVDEKALHYPVSGAYDLAVRSPVYHLGKRNFVLWRPTQETVTHCDAPCIPFYTVAHYGHDLLENITHLWVDEYVGRVKLINHYQRKAVPSYLLDFVKPLGYGESDFVMASQACRCDKLYLPVRAYMHSRYITEQAKAVWRKIAEYYSGKSTQNFPRKIYISREGADNRALENETECRKLFETHGFVPIKPETMSIPDQVAMFAKATHVAGPIGSGMHNTVFSLAPDKLKILYMMPENYSVQSAFLNIEAEFDRPFNTVMGAFTKLDGNKECLPWTISVKAVRTAIAQWL